jgi:23S rRNA (uracil1939-C5)-methyltransferase
MLRDNQQVDLLIEKPVAGGRMLARHEGQVVLVGGTIPGERVRVRIDRVGRGVAFASLIDILAPSPDRRTPHADADTGAGASDPLCGGNVYAHVAYAAQPAIKREVLRDALRHGGRLEWPGDLPVAASPEHGYRMRARLHVRGGRAGFFREGTHDLCDARCTGQLLPETLDAIEPFIAATPKSWLDAIDAIELAENLDGDQRALHVLWSTRVRPPRSLPPDAWNIETLPGLTGISMDNPFSGRARTVSGVPIVSDPLARIIDLDANIDVDARLQRQASSFFQANRFLLPQLVAAVTRHACADADASAASGPILDLYAGVGLFAVCLAASGRDRIIAIEGDPVSAHDLRLNAQPFATRLAVEQTSVEQFLAQASASASASAAADATLIVDPPRTGMSREAITAIIGHRARRLIYVSCDVATLARDLRRLLDSGYTLTHLEAFDLFPNTAHIESLAVLTR